MLGYGLSPLRGRLLRSSSVKRLELGVEYFGFAVAVTFEETILVFQWRDTYRFLALAFDVRPEFLWVGVEVFTDYFF